MAPSTAESLQEFLSLADKLVRPSDITILLKYLADNAKADGIIFWRLAPGSILTAAERKGRFFPVASWCRFKDVLPWYSLPVHSITGDAWLDRDNRRFTYVPSVQTDARVTDEARKALLSHWNMDSCASVPVAPGGDGAPNCVTFYRRGEAIDLDALASTVPLVRQLPTLHGLAADRQALAFLTHLSDTLHPIGDGEVEDRSSALVSARARLKAVCDLIADHFEATEASVLLAEETGEHAAFKVQASHWTWPSEPYAQEYRPSQGLTGWVLKNREPIRILDLARFDEDRDWIQDKFKGVDWRNLLDIKALLTSKFKIPEDHDLPVTSFVCVPVMHDLFLGAIRCCGRNKSPWSFDERDIHMLELAASFVGGWWVDMLEYVDLQKDSVQLKDLVDSVTRLHKMAGRQLVKTKSIESLLKETLLTAMRAIAGVDHGSIRQVDPKNNQLYYAVWEGPLWKKGSEKEIAARIAKRFPLDQNDPKSAGAYVVSQEKALIVNKPEQDPWGVFVFSEIPKRLYVPIRGQERIIGVLDLGRTSDVDFSERDAVVAENFAAQMGLYLYLSSQLEGRLTAQAKLREQQEEQLRTFENLRHQIYGPVGTAAMALEGILGRSGLPEDVRREITVARGDALRASIMVRSLELFSALAADRNPRVNPERLSEVWLQHRLDDLAGHQSTLARASRNISFVVQKEGIELLKTSPVFCDLNLLEHAASNLLENARKYSAKATKVSVSCGTMDHGRLFYIAVQNSGLRIEPADVPRMKERGWRSDAAWKVVGEGTGLGLYVVNAIMEAHRGRLQITPTNASNVNEVRLIFPARIPQP